jgi:TrmH family RNA methyltransferase
MIIEIQSLQNKKLKDFLSNKTKYHVCEGEKLVRDLLTRAHHIEILIVNIKNQSRFENLYLKAKQVWLVNDKIMHKISNLITPPDIIAIPSNLFIENIPLDAPLIFAFDSIQDPGNLGTIFRCAAAFRMKYLALVGNCVKTTNTKFIRAAQTAITEVIFEKFPNLEQLQIKFPDHFIVLTTARKTSNTIAMENIKFPSIILFGSEGCGFSEVALQNYPNISINQTTCIESLNVAVSTCIIMHELQRNKF